MKTKLYLIAAVHIVTSITALASDLSSAASTLTISHQAGESNCVVEVNDPGNHTWIMQRSDDLISWSEVGTLKVHNGTLRNTYSSPDPDTPQFFRGIHDPERQDFESTVSTALLLPATPPNYANQTLPAHLLTPQVAGQDNTPPTNLVTDSGALLGRVLFYDRRLSINQTISCSSCHQAEHGFSDPRPFSIGFDGGLTGRNSMGLSSAKYYARRAFFWDERAATLEDQVLQPIRNDVEMGMTLPELTDRLSAEPFYTELLTAAFGSPEVTTDRISRALAQFVRSIISFESKYDAGVPTNFSNFTAQENRGRRIFRGQIGNATCNACHGTDNFVPGNIINNNGLENPYVDKGVGGITGRAQDEGLFKVPSLRNIELTAPYMHDGRFATLEEVVEFYNSGVVNHPNLSPPLRTPPGPGMAPEPLRLNLSDADKAALVAFLKTLTDTNVTTDERFSDPFNYGD